jgi:hypothetical protein
MVEFVKKGQGTLRLRNGFSVLFLSRVNATDTTSFLNLGLTIPDF